MLGLRAVLLAILDFARIASALVVVVGVTSHLGSGAALSPRRCRIASVGAHNRTEMLRLRGVLLTILRLLGLRARLLSILAVYKRRFTLTAVPRGGTLSCLGGSVMSDDLVVVHDEEVSLARRGPPRARSSAIARAGNQCNPDRPARRAQQHVRRNPDWPASRIDDARSSFSVQPTSYVRAYEGVVTATSDLRSNLQGECV